MTERAVAVHTIGGKVSSYNPMTEEEMDDAMRHCTDAQLRILHLASKSHTPKEICRILNIKITTLTSYRKSNKTFHNLLNNIYDLTSSITSSTVRKLADADALNSYLNIKRLGDIPEEATASEKAVALNANSKLLELSGALAQKDSIGTINIGQVLVAILQKEPPRPQWER